MRVLFAGTPEIAVPCIDALLGSRHTLVGVLTAPDRPRGRGRSLEPPPVKARAVEAGLPVLQYESLRGEAREAAAALRPDLLACFAYGRIFGPRFLDLFPAGGLNVHPSLLPRFRGPSPVPAAILAGERRTGVTVQALAAEMDAGAIHAQEAFDLDGTETTASLSSRVAPIGAALLVRAIDAIESGSSDPRPQDHSQATYTRTLSSADGLIDWRRPADQLARMVRAYDPWPRARTTLSGETLFVFEAVAVPAEGTGVPGRVAQVDRALGILVETTDGLLAIRRLQLQARKPLDWKSFLNGVPDPVGAVLGG